ncbi:MAG TPA: type II secretion system protein [Candidatus Saccharimonadales bacterium]|nr:type II secretion system protein [Candidatus Saccharimonadales bacterium]
MLHFRTIKTKKMAGFTLLEVLLVVAIIAILAGIVIVAINPGKNLGDTRNTQRAADVNTIINALYQYELDNNGALPPVGGRTGAAVISSTLTEICNPGAAACTGGLIDLAVLSTNGKYLVAIPADPTCPAGPGSPIPACNANGSGYKVGLTSNGRLQVTAPQAENSKTISVTK